MNHPSIKVIKKEKTTSSDVENSAERKTSQLPGAAKERIIDNVTHWIDELHQKKNAQQVKTYNQFFQ